MQCIHDVDHLRIQRHALRPRTRAFREKTCLNINGAYKCVHAACVRSWNKALGIVGTWECLDHGKEQSPHTLHCHRWGVGGFDLLFGIERLPRIGLDLVRTSTWWSVEDVRVEDWCRLV